jgi:hypothetical protein
VRQRPKGPKTCNTLSNAVPVEIVASAVNAIICSPLTPEQYNGRKDSYICTSPPVEQAALSLNSMSVLTIDPEKSRPGSSGKVIAANMHRKDRVVCHDIQQATSTCHMDIGRSHLTLRELKQRDTMEAGAFIEEVTGTKNVVSSANERQDIMNKKEVEENIMVEPFVDHVKLDLFRALLREILESNDGTFEENYLLTEIRKISIIREETFSWEGPDISHYLDILSSQNKIYRSEGTVYLIN